MNKQVTGAAASLLFAAIFLFAFVQRVETSAQAEATIRATKQDTVLNGRALFVAENEKVKLTIEVTCPSMANRQVAVHLHEHGDCGNSGEGAHGHWNPTKSQHGKWGGSSFHLGDIGNISLDAQGKGALTLETPLWSIGGDSTKNIVGRAVIVHSGTDDYVTQPTGNAGSRIGCGVIQLKQ